jgi:hypothetical protein
MVTVRGSEHPTSPLATSGWINNDIGGAFRIGAKIDSEGRVFDIQLPHPTNIASLPPRAATQRRRWASTIKGRTGLCRAVEVRIPIAIEWMLEVLTVGEKRKQCRKNPVPLSVPLKLRLTRISTYLGGPGRLVSCSKYWLAGL